VDLTKKLTAIRLDETVDYIHLMSACHPNSFRVWSIFTISPAGTVCEATLLITR